MKTKGQVGTVVLLWAALTACGGSQKGPNIPQRCKDDGNTESSSVITGDFDSEGSFKLHDGKVTFVMGPDEITQTDDTAGSSRFKFVVTPKDSKRVTLTHRAYVGTIVLRYSMEGESQACYTRQLQPGDAVTGPSGSPSAVEYVVYRPRVGDGEF